MQLYNPGFETAGGNYGDGWTLDPLYPLDAAAWTVARVNTNARQGSAALNFMLQPGITLQPNAYHWQRIMSAAYAVKPGQSIGYGMWAYITKPVVANPFIALNAYVFLVAYDASGTFLQSWNTDTSNVLNTWLYLSANVVMPANAATIKIMAAAVASNLDTVAHTLDSSHPSYSLFYDDAEIDGIYEIMLTSPDSTGYTILYPDQTVSSGPLDGGASRTRADVDGGTGRVDVQWTCGPARIQYLTSFYRTSITEGSDPFFLDLLYASVGVQSYMCKIVPGTWVLASQVGLTYVQKATLEVYPLDVASDDDAAILMIYGVFGDNSGTFPDLLSTIVNTQLP